MTVREATKIAKEAKWQGPQIKKFQSGLFEVMGFLLPKAPVSFSSSPR